MLLMISENSDASKKKETETKLKKNDLDVEVPKSSWGFSKVQGYKDKKKCKTSRQRNEPGIKYGLRKMT